MAYQSFADRPGDSSSFEKWRALRLTSKQICDKDVLDLGCNEGFFCLKLVEEGARSALGLDYCKKFIDRAETHVPTGLQEKIKYDHKSWSELSESPDNSFDLILLLSAFHYATTEEWFTQDGHHLLLDNVNRMLRPGGVFVFEGGVLDSDVINWVPVKRIADVVRHPTRGAIWDLLNKTFNKVIYKGPSINQSGDPVPRFVFHCMKSETNWKDPTVVLVVGEPGDGKTTLAESLTQNGKVNHLNVDASMVDLPNWCLDENLKNIKVNLSQIKKGSLEIAEHAPEAFSKDFVEQVIKPLAENVIIADGYTLGIPSIQKHLITNLEKEGYHVWVMGKAHGQ
jgi:ubiquinone/menaquinone biosynthesis C-methylase UbiE